ncbi:MAG: hypothetical protein EA409_01425 [Saprospirales bacterium]|nr:MAG: hypothetical protein EA409_01425 [Saprospirales bacterium]
MNIFLNIIFLQIMGRQNKSKCSPKSAFQFNAESRNIYPSISTRELSKGSEKDSRFRRMIKLG